MDRLHKYFEEGFHEDEATVVLLALLLAVSPLFAGGGGEKKAEAPKVLKIALSAPFTGLGSILGEYIKEGALLAVDEINAAGGVNGAKFDLVVYDDQANASTASTVVRRALYDDNAIAIFGPNMSSAVIGVHTLAQQAKKPMLVGATSPSFGYDKVKNEYLFRLRADDGVKVAQQAKYIVENLKAKKTGRHLRFHRLLHFRSCGGEGNFRQVRHSDSSPGADEGR